jgi:hypothetical protein
VDLDGLDELFGDGTELGDDYVVKAQLRFRVHPPKHPVAQDIVDRIVSAYDERLDLICREVDDVLQHADLRRSERSQPLVVALSKAVQQPYSPGAKGGKWYRDGAGHIRYGEKPQGQFKQRAPSAHVAPRVAHLRPSPFMGMSGIDRDLTGFLMDHGGKYGFNKNELRFLGSWYGTDTKSGALFEAFVDCAGLTREDLRGDLAQLRFGAQELTYEEAVFEFFAAQRSLFMGDDSELEDADAEWNHMLNDEIKPLLDSVFSKYEALKEDDKFVEKYSQEGNLQCHRFYDVARRTAASSNGLANKIITAWDPSKQVAEVLAGMKKLGLFASPSKSDAHAHVTDRPHLKGSMTLNDRLLVDNLRSNPLIASGDKLATLTSSQLMLLYAAAELHRRWDPETRSYSEEKQAEIGPGALGTAVLEGVAGKSEQWRDAVPLVRKHLDVLVDRLVGVLNHTNVNLDPPPRAKRRSKVK